MKKYRTGYTQGVFDMFHIGHLNLINNAKEQCDHLIVGVNSDDLVASYKHKKPVINQLERQTIIANIKAVDESVIAETLDKVEMWNILHFDAVFIGDDWKGNPRWEKTSEELARIGVDVVFLPYTKGVTSTTLRPEFEQKIED